MGAFAQLQDNLTDPTVAEFEELRKKISKNSKLDTSQPRREVPLEAADGASRMARLLLFVCG